MLIHTNPFFQRQLHYSAHLIVIYTIKIVSDGAITDLNSLQE